MLDFFIGWWAAIWQALSVDYWLAMGMGIGTAFVLIAALVLWKIPRPVDYFKTKEGKGAAVGLFGAVPLLSLLCTLIVIILASLAFFFSPSAHAQPVTGGQIFPGTWFNDARLYMGLDHSRNQSVQCHGGGFDSRTTSNMGLILNAWQSTNERYRFNIKTRHNSCAINPDRNTTDAAGVELEVLLWCRKCN